MVEAQIAFDANPSDSLLLALNSGKSNLHNWLNAEAAHWKLKSGINWLQDGDRNTKFFHLSAKSRSLQNSIDIISVGEDEEQIKDQACNYFSYLMHSRSSISIPDEGLFNMEGPSVTAEQNHFLMATPSPSEIKEAIFGLKRNSSPRLDRFSGIFFTSCWQIVDPDVILVVSHFFSTGHLMRAINAYFLTLLPKIQYPDFQPINLLNFTYKIISKILVTRLSRILPLLISKLQSTFIKGRSIHHHVALAHDLFQKLNSKISGGSVCLKLDISKAFDKLQ